MNETVVIAIISASLSALINCAFQLVNKIIDNNKERRQHKITELELYKEKKEKVYLAAIGILLETRRGFDYTREMVIRNDTIQEEIKKINFAIAEISPQLRLYAPDSIFIEYYKLSTYSRFAYAPQNGPRLLENSKWAFDASVILLARLMQEDLGYRELSSDYSPVICPKCQTEHDIYSKCPSCGMTYSELKKDLQELLKIASDNSENQVDDL